MSKAIYKWRKGIAFTFYITAVNVLFNSNLLITLKLEMLKLFRAFQDFKALK